MITWKSCISEITMLKVVGTGPIIFKNVGVTSLVFDLSMRQCLSTSCVVNGYKEIIKVHHVNEMKFPNRM